MSDFERECSFKAVLCETRTHKPTGCGKSIDLWYNEIKERRIQLINEIKNEILKVCKNLNNPATELELTRLIFFKAQEIECVLDPSQLNDLVDELLAEINGVYTENTLSHQLIAGDLKKVLEKVPENTRIFIDSAESLNGYSVDPHELPFYDEGFIRCVQPFQAFISKKDGKTAVCITTHY
jgi:hypothetical protein